MQYQALELTDNQRRRDALEKEVAALKEEGLLVLGQVNALTQQIQRETEEAQALSEEEQALKACRKRRLSRVSSMKR